MTSVVVRVVDNGAGIPARDPRAHFRPVLHDQADGAGHGLGPRHRPASGPPQRRRDRGGVAAGPDRVPGRSAARRACCRRRNALNKPVLLVVDDDPQVLAAVRRDLRSRYREHYTIISAASGAGGAGDRPRTEEPRGFAGDGHQRSAHARHAGQRSARQVTRGLPAGTPRSAHRLFGYRGSRAGPSTTRISITICRSPGIRRRNASSPSSTISSTPGRPSICPRRKD